jgi:hypothetical protein
MRVESGKLERWRAEAAAEDLTLTAFVERCVDETLAVITVNREHDRRARLQADHLHRLPPTVARELLNRSVPPEAWPDPDERSRP